MPKPTPTTEKNWEKEFDNLFYKGIDRAWLSRGAESYGSVAPEMGRGELFRFIRTLLTKTSTEARAKAIEKAIEAIGEDAKYIAEGDLGYPEENRWVDGFNLANDEIRQRLNQLKEGK